jgi:hypothetical protein
MGVNIKRKWLLHISNFKLKEAGIPLKKLISHDNTDVLKFKFQNI